MNISYKVDGQYLIRSAFLPYFPSSINLVTGIENQSLGLIGGIVAKFLPLKVVEGIPSLESLIKVYAGELKIEYGELPKSAIYVGVDPDRHLLFSTVKEELISRDISLDQSECVLAKLGLNKSFFTRDISSLSGGEKMKVALAISLSVKAECFVLHGVLPWLDKRGIDLLKAQLLRLKKSGASVILFEHEIYPLKDIVDGVYKFDGRTIHETNIKEKFSFLNVDSNLVNSTQTLSKSIRENGVSSSVLQFKNVIVKKHPLSERRSNNSLLDDITFEFLENEIYLLIGENGVGKSTIAQIAFRIFSPHSGVVSLCGKPILKYSRDELIDKICYVGQFPQHQIVHNTVGECIKQLRQRGNDISLDLLKKHLKLTGSLPVGSLTFFQMKLLNLLTFISEKTRLVILDEPTWGLDYHDQVALTNILIDISKLISFSLLIITHDFSVVRTLSPKILWLHQGKVAHYDKIENFMNDDFIRSKFDIPM